MNAVVLTAALFALGQGPPAPAPVPPTPSIRMPVIPAPAPAPTPQPAPAGAPVLTPDVIYVIDADVQAVVITSPAGLASVTAEEGPQTIKGRFIDGNGKVETRKPKGKYLYFVAPVEGASGGVEVLVFPAGAQAAADVLRQTVQVDSGNGPQPPPPGPTPTTDFQAKVQAALLLDKPAPQQVATLADIYRKAPVSDPGIKTWGELVSKLQAVTSVMLPTPTGLAPPLNAARTLIASDLKAALGDNGTTPMDDAFRKLVQAEFKKVADALAANAARPRTKE